MGIPGVANTDEHASVRKPVPEGSWGLVFLGAAGDQVEVADSSSGTILSVDRSTGSIKRVGANAQFPMDSLVRGRVAADQNTIYFKKVVPLYNGRRNAFSQSNQIVRADLNTLAVTGVLKTVTPFFAMLMSKDEKTLFTLDPDTAAVGVIDAEALTQVKTKPNIGKRPILGLPVP